MTRKEAEEVAKKLGIKLKSKGKGIVVRQSIQAGTPANQTKQILIELS